MKVSELLSDESKWTKGVMARKEDGLDVCFMSDDACQWCLWGAILKCNINEYLFDKAAADPVCEKVASFIHTRFHPGSSISRWNDSPMRTFAEVRALIEELDI